MGRSRRSPRSCVYVHVWFGLALNLARGDDLFVASQLTNYEPKRGYNRKDWWRRGNVKEEGWQRTWGGESSGLSERFC